MTYVDILSQLDTFEDDPYADWIKFEDDVDIDIFLSFNNQNITDANDPFDTFKSLNKTMKIKMMRRKNKATILPI